jgi:uncharacterized protein YegL
MNDNNNYFTDYNFGDWDNSNIKSYRKVPLCLVVDTSGSMMQKDGTDRPKIEELNQNIMQLISFIRNDAKAARICDLSIIAFGGNVSVISGYDSVDNIQFQPLKAQGATPMGEAVIKAVELLKIRRNYYRNNDIEHYKPIMLLMSDGAPTDEFQESAGLLSTMIQNKELKIFPVGIGKSFDANVLKMFSPLLEPKLIKDTSGFAMLFRLLSSSTSNPNDDSLEKWFNDEF